MILLPSISWVILIEGNCATDVQSAAQEFGAWAQANAVGAPETAVYRHEFTRLKTPWSAG